LGTPFFERGYRFFGNLFLLGVQAIPFSKRDIRGEFILSLPKEIPLGTPQNYNEIGWLFDHLIFADAVWGDDGSPDGFLFSEGLLAPLFSWV
jgi:hypothetical protein